MRRPNSRPGELNGRARLTDRQVTEIAVAYHVHQARPSALAREYEVHRGTIWWALKRRWPQLALAERHAILALARARRGPAASRPS